MRFAKRPQNAGLPSHVYEQVEDIEAAATALLDVLDGHHTAYDDAQLHRFATSLRKIIEDVTPNVEFSGDAPLFGAASAGTKGYASEDNQ